MSSPALFLEAGPRCELRCATKKASTPNRRTLTICRSRPGSALIGGAPAKFSSAWENINAGLDGIAIAIAGLAPLKAGLIPLNIRIMDPICRSAR